MRAVSRIVRCLPAAATFAALGALGWFAAGPALGPALWWAMQQPTALLAAAPSVLGVALLVLGVIWLTSDSGEDTGPTEPPSQRAALLRRAWQAAREGRLTASLRERLGAAQDGEVFVPAQDDLDFAEAFMLAGRGLRF